MFNTEHIEILKKYQHHGETMKLGYVANLNADVVRELQQVYNEAVGDTQFDAWCNGCVFELVKALYSRWSPDTTEAEPSIHTEPSNRKFRRHGHK